MCALYKDSDRLVSSFQFRILSKNASKSWLERQGPWALARQLGTASSSTTSFNVLLRLQISDEAHRKTQWDSIKLSEQVALLLHPHLLGRKVSIAPLKVLEAPGLLDDFYLNLVHWAPKGGPIAVALGKSIVLVENPLAKRSRSFRFATAADTITCISHTPSSTQLATGLVTGSFFLWDRCKASCFFSLLNVHNGRIGAISWRDANVLSVGGRDRRIQHIDIRVPKLSGNSVALQQHTQEVCGLTWDHGGILLASGGNDNRLLIWDIRKVSCEPLFEFTDHTAAVKAISWSPFIRNLLISGGGTLDRRLVLRDLCQSNPIISAVDTGSQICNVQWSPDPCSLEIITSHGYTQNQLVLWRVSPQFAIENDFTIPKGNSFLPPGARLTPLVHFLQSSERIVHMSANPEGEHVITGSGDQTLKLWSVFKENRHVP